MTSVSPRAFPRLCPLGLIAGCSISLATAADLTTQPSTHAGGSTTATDESIDAHSWEAPALTVRGKRDSVLREEDRIGDYEQPRWTATRRFTEVRVYVIPKNQIEFEYWLFADTPTRHEIDDARASGAPRPKASIKQVYEVEMGLGYRMQLDLYQVFVKDGGNGDNQLDETKAELRYALADWGRLWGNPTLYGEWTQAAHGSDLAEFKLLLGDEWSPKWHWATNLVYEAELTQSKEHSHEWNSAISYTVIDGRFSIGLEDKIGYVTSHDPDSTGGFGDAKSHHWEISAGPCLQVRTVPRMHLDVSEFIGINKDAPESRTVAIIGWEF